MIGKSPEGITQTPTNLSRSVRRSFFLLCCPFFLAPCFQLFLPEFLNSCFFFFFSKFLRWSILQDPASFITVYVFLLFLLSSLFHHSFAPFTLPFPFFPFFLFPSSNSFVHSILASSIPSSFSPCTISSYHPSDPLSQLTLILSFYLISLPSFPSFFSFTHSFFPSFFFAFFHSSFLPSIHAPFLPNIFP